MSDPYDSPVEIDDGGGLDLIKSLPNMLWARRWLIILPAVVLSIAGVVAAFLIPPKYRSQATILIESAQLPADLVNSNVSDAIEQRIERVRQRVLSRGDLIQLIRTNGLYPDEQRSQPLSVIVDKMRASTSIEPIAADVSGSRGSNTVAFTISFEYPQPGPAQLVVQQFVNRFLELDASTQAEQATGAANFIGEQAESIQRRIAEIEAQITDIKAKNGTTIALGQFMGADPIGASARIDSEIDGIMADNTRLAATSTTGGSELATLRGQLRVLTSKYSDDHPDVIALRQQIAAAEKQPQVTSSIKTPEQLQIEANQARLASLRAAKGAIMSQSATSRAAAARAPAILAQIDQLEKQADTLRLQYQSVGSKLVSAETSARMESEQKGERFSVADPPVVPDAPYWPNRLMFVAGGVAAGFGLGAALALAVEILLRPIRGAAALRAATGFPPLAIIPSMEHDPSRTKRFLGRLFSFKWLRFGKKKSVPA